MWEGVGTPELPTGGCERGDMVYYDYYDDDDEDPEGWKGREKTWHTRSASSIHFVCV